jgi:pimeloyl-ACP methyl ester carboxylesterase
MREIAMSRPDIYSSASLAVRPNVADAARLAAEGFELVTFEPISHGNRPKVFGEAFATKYGVNALHIIPKDNSWYQYPDLDDCLAAVARVTGRSATAVGASMGAYAAVTLADRIGVARTVAMAPQFSIQRHLVPFEVRWAAHAAQLTFQTWDGSVAKGCRHYVIYEPDTLDAEHVKLIINYGDDVVPVAVPAGGHTVSRVLAESGSLSRVVLSVLRGAPSAADLLAEITPRLERSAEWHLNRGIHARTDEREAILCAGLAANPKHIKLHLVLGRLLLAQRRLAEALPHLLYVARRRPLAPRMVRPYLVACALAKVPPDPVVLEKANKTGTGSLSAA